MIEPKDWACPCNDDLCRGKTTEPAHLIVSIAQQLERATDSRILFSSGIRCEAHNSAVGGARNSRHLPIHGDAVDLKAAALSLREMWQAALRVLPLHLMGVGLYPWGMHLDARGEHTFWVDRQIIPEEGTYATLL